MSVQTQIERITSNVNTQTQLVEQIGLALQGASMGQSRAQAINYDLNMSTPIEQNTIGLQRILDIVNSLPEAGSGSGVELPTLTNPGSAEELFNGKQLIDSDGNVVTGTFTIDQELSEQDSLIDQINTAIQGKVSGGSGLPTQEKSVEITENGTSEILPDDGYALSKVDIVVNVPIPDGYIQPSGTLTITQNGEHNAREYEKVYVDVEASSSSDAEIPWITREVTEYSNSTLTKLGAYALSGTNITSLSLPALTTIAGYAFYECTKLTSMIFPLLQEVPYNGCRQFKGLIKGDFHALTKIGANGFYQCTNLETLIIRTNSLCTLAAGTVLTASKIQSGTGYIYVPASLVDSYKAATNWSSFASQIRAIEDYPDICD